jgi:Putative zinc-finger
MTRVKCSVAEKLILNELDEGIEPREKRRLDEHLSNCPSCRLFREETATLVQTIAVDVPADPGEDYWRMYRSSLDARLEEADRSRKLRPGWKLAGAFVMASLVALVYILSPVTPPKEPGLDAEDKATVIEELAWIYGPEDTDEMGGTNGEDRKLAMSSSQAGYDQIRLPSWFEVEDESNQTLL